MKIPDEAEQLNRKISKNAIKVPHLGNLYRQETDDSSLSDGERFQLHANQTLESIDTERPDWSGDYAHSERLAGMNEDDLRDHVNSSTFGEAMQSKVPSKKYHDSRKLEERAARNAAAKANSSSCCTIT